MKQFKNRPMILCLTLAALLVAVMAPESRANPLRTKTTGTINLECAGANNRGAQFKFRLLQDSAGASTASLYASTKPEGVSVRPRRLTWALIDRCTSAMLSGQTRNGLLIPELDGDLYVECDADGDAGWVDLKKTGANLYQGTIQSQDGVPELRLRPEEQAEVSCSPFKRKSS